MCGTDSEFIVNLLKIFRISSAEQIVNSKWIRENNNGPIVGLRGKLEIDSSLIVNSQNR